MQIIIESERQTPIHATCDVLVCGGGLGGVAAALAAARSGTKTILIERNSFVGGVATAGMCCSIFNCYYTASGNLGTRGIAVEIANALAEATGYGKAWHNHKGHVIYDIELGKWVLMDLLERAGVQLLLNAVIADAVMEGNQLKGVIIESKSGREAVLANVVVDATGDADVAALSGAPLREGHSSKHSLCFRLGNVDVDAFVQYFADHPDEYPAHMDVDWTLAEALAQYHACGTFLFPHGGGIQMQAFQKARASGDLPAQIGIHDTTDACQMHALRQTGIVHVVTGFVTFDGLNIETISRSVNDGRHMAFQVAKVYRKYIPGFSNAFVAGTAANLGVRASRWIEGAFVFTRDMMKSGVRVDDAVGQAVGCDHIKKHPGPNAWSAQVMHAEPFDLPYRCLLPEKVEGLIMGAGRSVSSENPWLLRVMVHTMVVGQAAGTAAAVAARKSLTPKTLDVKDVQTELKHQGA